MITEEQELDDLSLRDHNADEPNRLFNSEFYPHMTSLYNFAYRLSLNEDDAHDLLQETYEKALKSFRSYQANTHAKAWLFRIMKNSFINGYRRRSLSLKRWNLMKPNRGSCQKNNVFTKHQTCAMRFSEKCWAMK